MSWVILYVRGSNYLSPSSENRGALHYQLEQDTVKGKHLKTTLHLLHCLIPEKWVPFNDPCKISRHLWKSSLTHSVWTSSEEPLQKNDRLTSFAHTYEMIYNSHRLKNNNIYMIKWLKQQIPFKLWKNTHTHTLLGFFSIGKKSNNKLPIPASRGRKATRTPEGPKVLV